MRLVSLLLAVLAVAALLGCIFPAEAAMCGDSRSMSAGQRATQAAPRVGGLSNVVKGA